MSTTRRQVLRGMAGFGLALPFLPSLLPRGARAAGSEAPRFIAMATNHGGVWQPHLYPTDDTLTDQRPYAGHEVRRGTLSATASGGRASLSPILTASDAVLTPALVAKMNVMRGFDVPFYLAHHSGGHLGNYAFNDGNGKDGEAMHAFPWPTVDQVLAWSSDFYPDTTGILERSLTLGGNAMSAGYANPGDGSGIISALPSEFNSLSVFRRIFRQRDEDPRKSVVDLVIDDYRRLRDSDRRLSSADRTRLNDHVERLHELERKLSATASCEDLAEPTRSSNQVRNTTGYHQSPDLQKEAWQLLNDVIVAAFSCDSCRVATLRLTNTFSDYAGDWHQDIAHQAGGVSWAAPPTTEGDHPHSILARGHQQAFEHVFADLASKLLAVETAGGGSLLDATLLQWSHESGPATHDPIEMPVITAGGACNAISTGHYADFRNLDNPAMLARDGNAVTAHTGLIYNQWLGTVLQAMGLDRTRFERDDWGGYGQVMLSTEGWYSGYDKYGPDVLAVMGDRVPFVG